MGVILMKGNEAIGEAAIIAGCRHYFGYPITPQNELPAYMAARLPKVGGTFLQAESEVAAINMVFEHRRKLTPPIFPRKLIRHDERPKQSFLPIT